MQVVLENDLAEQLQASFFPQKIPKIKHDLDRLRACEHRQPAHDGASHEVWMVVVVDAVARPGHGEGRRRETEFRGMRSQTEFGNE